MAAVRILVGIAIDGERGEIGAHRLTEQQLGGDQAGIRSKLQAGGSVPSGQHEVVVTRYPAKVG